MREQTEEEGNDMNIVGIAETLLKEKFGDQVNSNVLSGALTKLFVDETGTINITSLLSKFQSSGAAGLLTSWLGSGENEKLSTEQVKDVFGGQKLVEFASETGLDFNTATSGLASVIPEIIDRVSGDGDIGETLLKSVGGLDGLAGIAKKFY